MTNPLTLIRKHAIYVSYASCKTYNCMHFISSHGKYLDHDNMDEMSHCSLNNIIININETLHILRQTRRLVDLHISEYFPHISLSTVDRLPCGNKAIQPNYIYLCQENPTVGDLAKSLD